MAETRNFDGVFRLCEHYEQQLYRPDVRKFIDESSPLNIGMMHAFKKYAILLVGYLFGFWVAVACAITLELYAVQRHGHESSCLAMHIPTLLIVYAGLYGGYCHTVNAVMFGALSDICCVLFIGTITVLKYPDTVAHVARVFSTFLQRHQWNRSVDAARRIPTMTEDLVIQTMGEFDQSLIEELDRSQPTVSLPTEPTEPEDIEEDSVCSICLEPNSENVVHLSDICKHNFHKGCIDQWTRRKKECPFCRLTPSDVSEVSNPDETSDPVEVSDATEPSVDV